MMKEIVLEGRLGNVLFQLANAYSNININDNIICNISLQQVSFIQQLRRAFLLKFLTKLDLSKNRLNNFEGYFVSEKYFSQTIRQMFQFSSSFQNLAKEFAMKFNINYNNTVSMTIRRGDFITLNGIWISRPKEYYISAYKKYFNNKQIIVSSDDIAWCKQNFKDLKCIYLNDFYSNPVDLLCILSSCKYSIGSSSSFSWWTAWLNEQKDSINVFPTNYYDLTKLKNGQKTPTEDVDDIFPKRWIRFNYNQ